MTLAMIFTYEWTDIEGVDTPFDFSTPIEKETNLHAIERAVSTPGDTPSDTPGSENQQDFGNDDVDNPGTADSITLYMTVATIALLGLGATGLIAKKSRR